MTEPKPNPKMQPKDVLKLIKRARAVGPCHIGLHCGIDMPTEEGTFYPYRVMVTDLTLRQAVRMLTEMQGFHDRKVAAGEKAPLLEVRDSTSEYDKRTRFISFG